MMHEPDGTAAETSDQNANQGSAEKAQPGKPPAAGPHAKPSLTDHEKTPGAGTLPGAEEDDVGDGASS